MIDIANECGDLYHQLADLFLRLQEEHPKLATPELKREFACACFELLLCDHYACDVFGEAESLLTKFGDEINESELEVGEEGEDENN